MSKLITNANAKYEAKAWTSEQYIDYRELQQNKLDVFYAKGRLTESQYNELADMWLDTKEPEEDAGLNDNEAGGTV